MDELDVPALVQTFNANVDAVAMVFPVNSDEYFKAYVILVAGFVKKSQALDLGKKLIKTVPREYFTGVMPKQMEEDDLFAATMCRLAEMYRAASLVEPPTFAAPKAFIMPRANA